MSQFFSIRWPHFARLEAILFFPAGLMLAIDFTPVRAIGTQLFIQGARVVPPDLVALMARLGAQEHHVLWAAMAGIVVLPYLAILMVADRLLTVRKGYALLSLIAIGIWVMSATYLSGNLRPFAPDVIADAPDWLPFDVISGAAVGLVAFILHLYPLYIGLRDRGDVADRLVMRGDRVRSTTISPRQAEDLYRLRTQDFRGWRAPDQDVDRGPASKEHGAVRALYALIWIGVVAVGGYAFFGPNEVSTISALGDKHSGVVIALPHPAADPKAAGAAPATPLPKVSLPPQAGSAPAGALPAVAGPSSLTPGRGGGNVLAIPSAPILPAVQRPGEASMVEAPRAGPNEAVAERGKDGYFAFDAVVNGTHIPMLFDTGASVIALRAEDAARLGIPAAKLTYSAKVKTANGVADVAPLMFESVTVGNITLRNVPGFVARQGALQENLLGQAFLARLAGYNVENNRLVLKGR